MYPFLLYLHSWLRWAILILAVITIYKSFIGSRGNIAYSKADNAMSAAFMGLIHLMLLVGLPLYMVSPFALNRPEGVNIMKEAAYRYWAVEHVSIMIIAVILITVGRIVSKKAATDQLRFKKQFIYYGIGLILILSRIPWGEAGRLFRF